MSPPRKEPFKGKGAESREARIEATATVLTLRQCEAAMPTDAPRRCALSTVEAGEAGEATRRLSRRPAAARARIEGAATAVTRSSAIPSAIPDDRAHLLECLHDCEQRRLQLEGEGVALVQRWAGTFPQGSLSFRLVRLAGESNTLLRWRSSGPGSGGSLRAVRGGRFELIDEQGLFEALPQKVRACVLDYEKRRIQLNYDYAIAAYRAQRMRALDAQRQALAALRGLHGAAPGRDNLGRENPAATR